MLQADLSAGDCARQFTDEPQLQILRNDATLGFAAACNIGCSQTKGDFVLFLSPGCRLDEGAISELLRTLLSDAAVGIVGRWPVDPNGTEQLVAHHERDALLGLLKRWRKRQRIQATRIATLREIWRVMDTHIVPPS